MKWFIAIAIMALMLAACTTQKPVDNTPIAPTEQEPTAPAQEETPVQPASTGVDVPEDLVDASPDLGGINTVAVNTQDL